MSLPTCPSCGQSVLEDDAIDCPFCGAAMDGSRGAKNTPRPKANPVANRPGARKMPENPQSSSGASAPGTPAEAPRPVARPARAGRHVVDEDDPFGVGSAAATSQAIQATDRPGKGRLHKVVCPMCEQVGFIPKSAIGKSVRCANEKCMVPVFTATDPDEQGADRKPARLSDEAAATRKAAEASGPAKRNPLVIYGIVGAVLLGLTLVILPMLTKPPDISTLNEPFKPPENLDFGPTEEELAELARKEAEKLRAAADAVNPAMEVQANTKRMISLARQPNLRDKALTRCMTGDLYLRLGNAKLAAQEFNQLLEVGNSQGYYRIDPELTLHWRALAKGDPENAKKALSDALAELPRVPATGRVGIEAALGLAAALVNDGKIEQATELIAARQLDTTIPYNRDNLAATSWVFIAERCQDAHLEWPPFLDAVFWVNPLHTAVALDLAIHDRWKEAIAWTKTSSDPRAMTDALVAISDIAAAKKASAEVLSQIESAVDPSDVASSLRVRSAIAAASKDTARLDGCLAMLEKLAAATPAEIPTSTRLVQDEIPDRSAFLYQAIAVAETVRAAVAVGKSEQADAAMNRFLSALTAAAPKTAAIRAILHEIATNEGGFKKQLAGELRVQDETLLNSMFRNYRRHLEKLAEDAETRRLVELLLVARLVRSGGLALVQKTINASEELRQELFLDELSGLMAISARRTGQQFPEAFEPDASLRKGRARFGTAALIIPAVAVADYAWANREQNLAAGVKALESRAGTDLPGMRQAMVFELVDSAARSAQDPAVVLTAISGLQNGVWREKSYVIAGRVFAARKLDGKAEEWMEAARIPVMEQICLLYGISMSIMDRPVPVINQPGDSKGATK